MGGGGRLPRFARTRTRGVSLRLERVRRAWPRTYTREPAPGLRLTDAARKDYQLRPANSGGGRAESHVYGAHTGASRARNPRARRRCYAQLEVTPGAALTFANMPQKHAGIDRDTRYSPPCVIYDLR
jgi:hypothetical protein